MFGAEKNPKEKSFETATVFHGIPQNTHEHKHTLVFLVDKQFPLELIGAVCLELLCCEVFLLLYTDRLPRRKITLGLLKNPQKWSVKESHRLGRKQPESCGINPCERRILSEWVFDQRTVTLHSQISFLCSFCFLAMQLPSGFLYLGNWGWSSPGEDNK